jgi:hypothetical protein
VHPLFIHAQLLLLLLILLSISLSQNSINSFVFFLCKVSSPLETLYVSPFRPTTKRSKGKKKKKPGKLLSLSLPLGLQKKTKKNSFPSLSLSASKVL